MIQINNIHISYDGLEALKGISCQIEEGKIFGFIGPDGAGKTSLFRILTTLLIPSKGNASVNGYDVVKDYKEIRKIVGYMPGKFSLYQDLSVEENLNFFAGVFHTTIEENYHLIEDIYKQIEPFKHRRAGKLSGGMKQKLALSCALIHKPKVLFLDEPTTGVDAVSRKEFWQMLRKLKEQGITIVVSTPYMDEAVLCDSVALMQKGRIMTIDTPEAIEKAYPHPLVSVKATNIYNLLKDLNDYPLAHSAHLFGDRMHLSFKSEELKIDSLQRFLEDRNHRDIEITEITAGIEDCFMNLMHE